MSASPESITPVFPYQSHQWLWIPGSPRKSAAPRNDRTHVGRRRHAYDWSYQPVPLEIRLLGLRKREQVLVEMVRIILGAHRFQQWILHLAPALHHVEGFVEGVGILYDHVGFEGLPVGG